MVNHCRRLGKISLGSLPLDGLGSAFTPLQLHPVFGAVSRRVPPNDAMSRFVGFGDKIWDNLKNFFQTQDVEFFVFVPKELPAVIRTPIVRNRPFLKLNRSITRKPLATTANDWSRAASNAIPKPQVRRLRCWQGKGVVSGGLLMSRR